MIGADFYVEHSIMWRRFNENIRMAWSLATYVLSGRWRIHMMHHELPAGSKAYCLGEARKTWPDSHPVSQRHSYLKLRRAAEFGFQEGIVLGRTLK